jgi:hypothetical protein
MTAEELREAIREILAHHPAVKPSPAGHKAYAELYRTDLGLPIGLEPRGKRHQNIWVRSDSVRPTSLKGIDRTDYDHSQFHVSKPNHDLFVEDGFKDADLTCFKVTNLWDAVRVVAEVASRAALA